MPADHPSATRPMRCYGCGYALDGLTEHRCPECGRAFDPDDSKTYFTRFADGWRYLLLSILGVCFIALPLLIAPLI
jgi:hypothetical protein